MADDDRRGIVVRIEAQEARASVEGIRKVAYPLFLSLRRSRLTRHPRTRSAGQSARSVTGSSRWRRSCGPYEVPYGALSLRGSFPCQPSTSSVIQPVPFSPSTTLSSSAINVTLPFIHLFLSAVDIGSFAVCAVPSSWPTYAQALSE